MGDVRIRLEDVPGFATDGRKSFGIDDGDLAFFGGTGLPEGWYSVKDFGALGDGTTNDTAAIQAAIAAAGAGGGVVYFPPGVFLYTHLTIIPYNGCITFRGAQGYQWQGPNTSAQPRTTLRCTHTGTTDGISCFMTGGFLCLDIQFEYVNGFTGVLLNIGGDGGTGSNTNLISRCRFQSNSTGDYRTARCFIGFQDVVCSYVEYCTFANAQAMIRGADRDTGTGGPHGFSNDIIIEKCSFDYCGTAGHIVNPYLWTIRDNTFEFSGGETPTAITSDWTSFPSGDSTKIVVASNQFWDPYMTGQIPIVQPAGVEWDMVIRDNWFHNFNNVCIQLGGTGAFVIEGNTFLSNVPVNTPTLIDLGDPSTAHKELVRIMGNFWRGIDSGSQDLAIINYAGHGMATGHNDGSVQINNNSQTGPWETAPPILPPFANPSGVILNSFNSGRTFRGGTLTMGLGTPPGAYWNFAAVPFSGETPVITFPAATRTIYIEGVADTGHTSLTLTAGTVTLRKITIDGAGGVTHGIWNFEIHGTYTVA